jgi:pimeloyl-ACP methyl ester carboxylesterase
MNFCKCGVAILALMCGGAAGYAESVRYSPRPYRDWQSAYALSNGVSLHYWRTGGAGKPVLILAHGITDYGLNYAFLAEKFAADYDIILYDARGHGYSDKPDGPYDLATHMADLVGLIKALKIEKPILMGHSMGGSTITLLAASYPDLPRAIILEDPANMNEPEQGLTAKVIPDWKAQIETNKKIPVAELIRNARTRYHPGWTDATYELWAESKRLVSPSVVNILHGDGFGDATKTFPKITVPTLILKADADAAHRARHRRIAQVLAHGHLVHIDGAGHVIRNDRPVEVERELRAFLAELKQPSSRN